MRRKAITIGVVICAVAIVAGGLAVAQPPQGGRPGQGPGGPGRFDPERMRQMFAERMKEQLGVTDQEWQVIQPRLTKVMELNRESMAGGMGRMFGGFRRPRRGDQDRGPDARGRQDRPGRPERELTAVEKAADQLSATLENESASAEEIKKQLTTLRAEREKAKQELAKAQQELREILTLRQEAQLVLMGLLN